MAEIYTVYAEKDDMTFIITKDKETCTISVTGFYFGEPDDDATQAFNNKPLTAELDPDFFEEC